MTSDYPFLTKACCGGLAIICSVLMLLFVNELMSSTDYPPQAPQLAARGEARAFAPQHGPAHYGLMLLLPRRGGATRLSMNRILH